jgi:hypothetical protein
MKIVLRWLMTHYNNNCDMCYNCDSQGMCNTVTQCDTQRPFFNAKKCQFGNKIIVTHCDTT